MDTPSPIRVVIIGGGIAGLATAVALRSQIDLVNDIARLIDKDRAVDTHNVTVEVYEQWKAEPKSSGGDCDDLGQLVRSSSAGGLQLGPNGMRALQLVRDGLDEKWIRRGHPCNGMRFRNETGAELCVLEQQHVDHESNRYKLPAVTGRRASLLSLLEEECRDLGVCIHYGAKVESILLVRPDQVEQPDDGRRKTKKPQSKVSVSFANCEQPILADLVIGADGVHSRARAYVSPETVPEYTGIVGFGGFMDGACCPPIVTESDLPDRSKLEMQFGPIGFFGFGVGHTHKISFSTRKSSSSLTSSASSPSSAFGTSPCSESEIGQSIMWWSTVPMEGIAAPDLKSMSDVEAIQLLRETHRGWAGPSGRILCAAKERGDPIVKTMIHDVRNLSSWHGCDGRLGMSCSAL